jgi:hypothetical protein
MRRDLDSKVRCRMNLLPGLFGCIGLIVCAAYEAQRSGALIRPFYSLDRMIQHNLGAIAGLSTFAALLGIGTGLLILRRHGQSRLVTSGTIICIAVLLWSVIGLSL